MANTSNYFTGLVQITGDKWQEYETLKSTGGKLIFADIIDNEGEHTGKYIYANGIEYKILESFTNNIIANSSTSNYININSSTSLDTTTITVGTKVVNLIDASLTNTGLADALDVRQELEDVEYVLARVNASISGTLGLNPNDYSVNWTNPSWNGYTYKLAIESISTSDSGVTTFGGKTGDISIKGDSETDGSINFVMNGSILTGNIVGWNSLVQRIADISQSTINNDASIIDLSVNIIPTINNSINTINGSVSGLETWKNNTLFVNSITGDSYVKTVGDVTTGNVTLTTIICDISTATEKTSGLATAYDVSAFINEQFSWAIIGED